VCDAVTSAASRTSVATFSAASRTAASEAMALQRAEGRARREWLNGRTRRQRWRWDGRGTTCAVVKPHSPIPYRAVGFHTFIPRRAVNFVFIFYFI
jgi:hypothetical protein